MNPVRAFGPAVINNSWHNHYVYWVGPLIGGVLGGVSYEYLFMRRLFARPKGVPSLSGDHHKIE